MSISNYFTAFGYYGYPVDNTPDVRETIDSKEEGVRKGLFDYGYLSGNVQHIAGYVPGLAFLAGLVRIILAVYQLWTGKDFYGHEIEEEERANLCSEIGRGVAEALQLSVLLIIVDIIFTGGRYISKCIEK